MLVPNGRRYLALSYHRAHSIFFINVYNKKPTKKLMFRRVALALTVSAFCYAQPPTCADVHDTYVASTCCVNGPTHLATCPTGCSPGHVNRYDVCILYDVTGGPRDDGGFNQAAATGFIQATSEYASALTYKEVYPAGLATKAALQQESLKCDSLIGIGFAYQSAANVFDGESYSPGVGAEFPDVEYTAVDPQPAPYVQIPPNVRGAVFQIEQGTFLTGAAAALQSITGKVCFLAAVPLPNIIPPFVSGFLEGVAKVNSDFPGRTVTAEATYLNPTNGFDFNQFNNATGAYDVAERMYENGCDVIAQALGGAGAGAFQAAMDHRASHPGSNVWAIGVDVDQYVAQPQFKSIMLTSSLKRVDRAVYDAVKDKATTGSVTGGFKYYNASNDGVGYATSGGYLSAATIAQLEEYKAEIASGAIVVSAERTEL